MKEFFPDGTLIDDWFYETELPKRNSLGKEYIITDYGIKDDSKVYTKELQSLIDTVAANGGGCIVVPEGTYMTGALFFKQGVNLYICENGTLKGSDDISDYPVIDTRIEGESCKYFSALINVDCVDGFTLCGEGTIDGNGQRSWRAFWQRRSWNPACTNKDEQRPRLVFISNSTNITVAGVNLINSHFWTNHLYRCSKVKYLNVRVYSPATPIKAPSTDAIDIDVCTDVLVKNCYLEVNDDSVVLKGGKGPYADTAPENGSNERIIVEDCTYGFCHGCLTCGSESIHNRNIIVRRIEVKAGYNLLWLKMRPDTPQHYEYILMEDVKANINNFVNINPWTQFYDLKDRKEIPLSYADHITVRNCEATCDTFFNVLPDKSQYELSEFTFENIKVSAARDGYKDGIVEGMKLNDVVVSEGKKISKNDEIEAWDDSNPWDYGSKK